MDDLLETARQAARAGAVVLRARWGKGITVEHKSAFDFVTDADRASEAAILDALRVGRPGDAILSEEQARDTASLDTGPGVLWVVDPLDGTTNFIHGFPHVAVSIAALDGGRPVAGVILDVIRGEEFCAARGRGATLDGRPIRVSSADDPAKALLLTGFPFRHKERMEAYLGLFAELHDATAAIRRAGSAALDLAYVACGRAEGFWEAGLGPWDVAAGVLIVEEAGGTVSDFDGGTAAIRRGDVVAATPCLHAFVQGACARRFPGGYARE
jgi:myo-inositol-1(or 4)-monophosphatase